MKSERVLRVTLFLIVAELLLGGLAAALNRTLVEMPAWHPLGAGALATFSRMADLGNGEIMYPLVGIGGPASILLALPLLLRRPDGGLWPADCSYHAESASHRRRSCSAAASL